MNKQSYLFTVTGTYLWAVVAESAGVVGFNNKNRIVQRREEPVYLHFLESCMQNYFEGFAYDKDTIDADAIKLLKKEEINFLKTLEIQRFID